MKSYWQLNIRNQIHGTIILVSVISFFVIGIATILFFIGRYENTNRDIMSKASHIMENEVKSFISGGWRLSDTLQQNNASQQGMEFMINKISEIHGTDVNLYDLHGNLRVSSLPLVYLKGITSTQMNPIAFYKLDKDNVVQYYQDERLGKLNYSSIYIPVITRSGAKYAYLNIPYFTSASKLKQEISNFLVTIINLNAFIFLIAGIVALFLANRITSSFSLIANKMKKVNLGTTNEVIEWKRKDEIGALVTEYNKMVNKLDESATALAKTEREGAWREMARQIAHEIKNPLTPMKLSMQYLQRSIENNDPNIKKLTADVSNTLVEQIDHLTQIANEFSQFANIEQAKNEEFDLNEVLRTVLHLYSSSDQLKLKVSLVSQPVIILADRTHINRIFNNLIQNALQAVTENTLPVIEIIEEVKDEKIIIQVKDNGLGIDTEVQPFIFTPNFTTKTSGTGLGLAMCKRMVEQAHGKIWFETIKGTGTTFFVEFPLAEA